MRHTYRPRMRGFTLGILRSDGHRTSGLARSASSAAIRSGFTLIELLIVIAIIGSLAAALSLAVKRRIDRSRTDPMDRTAAVQLAEQQGIRTVEVVASWRTRRLSFREQAVLGCLGDDESVIQVEGIDRKEQRVRLTVCCHPAAGTVKCAIPLPMHPFPGDR